MVFPCLVHDQEVCLGLHWACMPRLSSLRDSLVRWTVMVSLSNTYLSLVPVFAPSFPSSSRKNVSLLFSFDYLQFLANVMRSRFSHHSRLQFKLVRRYLQHLRYSSAKFNAELSSSFVPGVQILLPQYLNSSRATRFLRRWHWHLCAKQSHPVFGLLET